MLDMLGAPKEIPLGTRLTIMQRLVALKAKLNAADRLYQWAIDDSGRTLPPELLEQCENTFGAI